MGIFGETGMPVFPRLHCIGWCMPGSPNFLILSLLLSAPLFTMQTNGRKTPAFFRLLLFCGNRQGQDGKPGQTGQTGQGLPQGPPRRHEKEQWVVGHCSLFHSPFSPLPVGDIVSVLYSHVCVSLSHVCCRAAFCG